MADWKTVGIIIGPIATALLTTGIVQQYLTDIYQQLNQPDIRVSTKMQPNFSHLSMDMQDQPRVPFDMIMEILNHGKSANDLRMNLAFPPSLKEQDVSIKNLTMPNGTIVAVKNQEGYDFDKLGVSHLSPSDTTRLVIRGDAPIGTNLERIPCTFRCILHMDEK